MAYNLNLYHNLNGTRIPYKTEVCKNCHRLKLYAEEQETVIIKLNTMEIQTSVPRKKDNEQDIPLGIALDDSQRQHICRPKGDINK